MRRTRLWPAVGALTLAAGLTACGGGGVSKADYLTKADGACGPGNATLGTVATPSNLPELSTAAGTVATTADAQAAALRKVKAPGDDKAVVTAMVGAIGELGVDLKGILLTHTHFDHVGAVAPVAKATGAEVWVPEIEKPVLQDIMAFVPWAGFGPYESWDAEHTLAGGETLQMAGFDIDVLFTPGHSPGHVTFSIPEESVVFSGDVLFQGSVGRTDLPGGDWPTLLESIRSLVEGLPPETTVYPGHMGITTLGAERASNPFLAELAG